MNCEEGPCSIDVALEKIGGKWKLHILYYIDQGVHRPSDLGRKIPYLSKRVLSRQIQELLDDKIISRKIHNVVPPKVEYFLSELGLALRPILTALDQWGELYIENNSSSLK